MPKFLISDAPSRKVRTNVSCAAHPDGAPPDVSRNSSLLVPPPPRVKICIAATPPLSSRRADICRSAYLFRSDSQATSRPRVCGHGPPGAQDHTAGGKDRQVRARGERHAAQPVSHPLQSGLLSLSDARHVTPSGSCITARPPAEVGWRLGDVSALVPSVWTPQHMWGALWA